MSQLSRKAFPPQIPAQSCVQSLVELSSHTPQLSYTAVPPGSPKQSSIFSSQLQKIKPLNKTQLKALQRKQKESSDFARFDYVKVPKKAYTDEDKYEKMMRSGKKLSDAQLKAYSRAVKLTTDYMAEIDGRQYISRSIRDRE